MSRLARLPTLLRSYEWWIHSFGGLEIGEGRMGSPYVTWFWGPTYYKEPSKFSGPHLAVRWIVLCLALC